MKIAKTSHKVSFYDYTNDPRPSLHIQRWGFLIKSMVRQQYLKEEKKNVRPFEQVGRSQLLACSQQKHFIHQHFHLKHFQKTKLFVCILIKRESLQRHFSKSLSKTHCTDTSLNYFQNQHFVHILIETRIITKLHFQNTFKNHTKHNFKQKQVIQQVTKSPWKTRDEKGANTFPFHNLPPELKKTSQRSFLCFFTFPFG